MNRKSTLNILIVLSLLTFSGCISHSIFIDLSGEPEIHYSLEGDSLDLYDNRLQLPGDGWSKTGESRRKQDDEIIWNLEYEHPLGTEVTMPVSPPGEPSICQSSTYNFLLFKLTKARLDFPGWNVSDRFGNLTDFFPDEVALLDQPGIDSLLTEGEIEGLRRKKAVGLQKATARRYMMYVQHLIQDWYSQRGTSLDSLVLSDAMERFDAVLHGHLLFLKNEDPMDVSLEWYPELRSSIILAATQATRGDEKWFVEKADSIDHDWKIWKDLEDDSFKIMLKLPVGNIIADPDSISGDTLFWSFAGADLENKGISIAAAGWTPSYPWIAVFVLLLAGAGFILIRNRRSKKAAS